tara:strand:+ start:5116 stop:5832 length:717 start_codon:yes stop_codon:yes gene_type:complete
VVFYLSFFIFLIVGEPLQADSLNCLLLPGENEISQELLSSFDEPYFKGVLMPDPENLVKEWGEVFGASRVSEVHRLGSGGMGGDVYRVRVSTSNHADQEIVLKKYYANTDAQADFTSMKLLSDFDDSHLKIAKVEWYNREESIVEIQNIQGWELRSILKNKRISEKAKKRIFTQYTLSMNLLDQFLKKKGFKKVAVIQKNGLYSWIRTSGGKVEEIVIHPGQVIVDPQTLKITIIDPS